MIINLPLPLPLKNTLNVRTHTTEKIQTYNYYKSVGHNSLENKAVKRWLLSCSYMISCNIKILFKHMFHLFLVNPGESPNPTVITLTTELVNALPGELDVPHSKPGQPLIHVLRRDATQKTQCTITYIPTFTFSI